MQTIQLIQISPDELSKIIADAVDKSLTKFFDEVKQSSNANQHRELMTRKEVADFFSVSLVTVHEWMNCGILSSYKIGNRTYFKSSEILELVFNSRRK